MVRAVAYGLWVGLASTATSCKSTSPGADTLAASDELGAAADTLDSLGSPVLRGSNPGSGVVDVTLEVKEVDWDIGGQKLAALTYNGVVPGPTIVADVGDELVLTVKNLSPHETILHPHGFILPHKEDGTGLSQAAIKPGQSHTHRFKLLHPGTYWYHSHSHHDAAKQIGRGLYAAIIVRDKKDPQMTEKVIVISNVKVDREKGVALPPNPRNLAETHDYLINGKLSRSTTIRPGESQRLRVVNATVEHVVHLRLSNGRSFTQIATDGGLTDRPYEMKELFLDAAERADIVVTAPADATESFELIAERIPIIPKVPAGNSKNDPLAMLWSRIQQSYNPPHAQSLLKFTVEGAPTQAASLPAALAETPVPTREYIMAQSPAIREFTVGFSPALAPGGLAMLFPLNTPIEDYADPQNGIYPVTPRPVEKLGTWVIHRWKNNSPSRHPIHVHGFRFVVLSRNGAEDPIKGWKDTADLPAYGDLEYAIELKGYPGEWLYHCHFEGHMEMGFMGSMTVIDPSNPDFVPGRDVRNRDAAHAQHRDIKKKPGGS